MIVWSCKSRSFSCIFFIYQLISFVPRDLFFQKRVEENSIKLSPITLHSHNLSKNRQTSTSNSTDLVSNLLTKRKEDALCAVNSRESSPDESEGANFQDECSSTVIVGGNLSARNSVRPIRLPEVATLPPYTTWIFLDRCIFLTSLRSLLKLHSYHGKL